MLNWLQIAIDGRSQPNISVNDVSFVPRHSGQPIHTHTHSQLPGTIDSDYNQTNKTLNAINKRKIKIWNIFPRLRVSFIFFFSGFDKWLIFRWEFYIKAARSRTLTLIFIFFYLDTYYFFFSRCYSGIIGESCRCRENACDRNGTRRKQEVQFTFLLFGHYGHYNNIFFILLYFFRDKRIY